MFGIRTPTKNKPSPSSRATDRGTEAELLSLQAPAPTPATEAQKSVVEVEATTSQGQEEGKKSKVYRSRISEAAALQQSALVQLNAARNLKGEIKTAVTTAVKRLYELVRDGELQDKDKRDDQPSKVTSQVEPDKTDNLEEKIKRMEKLMENNSRKLEEVRMKVCKHNDAYFKDREENKILMKEIAGTVEKQMEKIGERDRKIEQKLEATYASVVAAGNKKEQKTEAVGRESMINRGAELHSMIISSTNDQETSDQMLNRIRDVVNAKEGGIKIDRVRKIKDGKVVIGCRSIEEKNKIKKRLEGKREHLEIKDVENKDPLVVIKNLLSYNTEEDIKQAIRTQNNNIAEGIEEKDYRIAEKYRRRARNPHESHVVLQVSPSLWQALTQAGKLHIDLQRVMVDDQSPLIQCMRCLGYGHGRKHCQVENDSCSHCGGAHFKSECEEFKNGNPPQCKNCKETGKEHKHNAFDGDCPTRRRWDAVARRSYAYYKC